MWLPLILEEMNETYNLKYQMIKEAVKSILHDGHLYN